MYRVDLAEGQLGGRIEVFIAHEKQLVFHAEGHLDLEELGLAHFDTCVHFLLLLLVQRGYYVAETAHTVLSDPHILRIVWLDAHILLGELCLVQFEPQTHSFVYLACDIRLLGLFPSRF